jgi:hypothetical protein
VGWPVGLGGTGPRLPPESGSPDVDFSFRESQTPPGFRASPNPGRKSQAADRNIAEPGGNRPCPAPTGQGCKTRKMGSHPRRAIRRCLHPAQHGCRSRLPQLAALGVQRPKVSSTVQRVCPGHVKLASPQLQVPNSRVGNRRRRQFPRGYRIVPS